MTGGRDGDRAGASPPRPRLVDEVTQRIREMVLTGEVKPGQQLLQASLCERLGVSRTPLREAFRVIESEGLVRISNRNGTVEVVQFTTGELEEMFELREAVDGLAARLAAEQGVGEETEARLRHLLTEMTSSEQHYDMARRAAAHLTFHALIVEVSANPYVVSYAPLVRASSAALYYPTPADPAAVEFLPNPEGEPSDASADLSSAMNRMDDQHRQIVDAITSRDPGRAEEVAMLHARTTKSSLANLDRWLTAMAVSRSHEHGPAAGVDPA